MNILTLGIIANYFSNLNISKNNTIYFGIFLYVAVTGVNFFTLFRKKETIIKKLEKLPIEKQRKGKLYVWLYALATIVLFMYVITYLVKPKY
jgi:hypothetical protein